jgi:hypothetical protein
MFSTLRIEDWMMFAVGAQFLGVWGTILWLVRKTYFKKKGISS